MLPHISFNGGNYICMQHLSGPFHSVGCDFAIVAWPPAEITGKRICGFDLDRTLHLCQKGVYNAVSSGKLIADVTRLDALQNPNS